MMYSGQSECHDSDERWNELLCIKSSTLLPYEELLSKEQLGRPQAGANGDTGTRKGQVYTKAIASKACSSAAISKNTILKGHKISRINS